MIHIKKYGFTLAEVLITLGIIGIVAAMTLPTLVSKHQKRLLQKQFLKAYSTVQQAMKKAEADLGYTPVCWYWEHSPYAGLGASCVEYTDLGDCARYEYADGSPLFSDHNGKATDCSIFAKQILANLNIVKTCIGNAVEGGCIAQYEGNDSIRKNSNPDLTDYDLRKATTGCGAWRKEYIRTSTSAYMLEDGSTIVSYGGSFTPKIFAIDVNGLKGPNKWGHDIFGFQSVGDVTNGIKLKGGGCAPTESKGVSTATMIKNIYKK